MKAARHIPENELAEQAEEIAEWQAFPRTAEDEEGMRYKEWLMGIVVANLASRVELNPEEIVLRAVKIADATIRTIAFHDLVEEEEEE